MYIGTGFLLPLSSLVIVCQNYAFPCRFCIPMHTLQLKMFINSVK